MPRHSFLALNGEWPAFHTEDCEPFRGSDLNHIPLTDEYDGGDDLPEEVDVRLGELEAAIDRYPVIGQPLQRVSRR